MKIKIRKMKIKIRKMKIKIKMRKIIKRKKIKKETKKDDEKKDQKNKSKPCTAILLGFDKFDRNEDNGEVSFNVYFVPVKNRITARNLKIPLKLKYKQSLRGLEDEEEELVAECKKREKKGEKKNKI
jgi:hypothetical protein